MRVRTRSTHHKPGIRRTPRRRPATRNDRLPQSSRALDKHESYAGRPPRRHSDTVVRRMRVRPRSTQHKPGIRRIPRRHPATRNDGLAQSSTRTRQTRNRTPGELPAGIPTLRNDGPPPKLDADTTKCSAWRQRTPRQHTGLAEQRDSPRRSRRTHTTFHTNFITSPALNSTSLHVTTGNTAKLLSVGRCEECALDRAAHNTSRASGELSADTQPHGTMGSPKAQRAHDK